MATTIMATRQVVADYQRLFVNRRAYTMQSMRPHPETGRHYYFRPSTKGTDIPLMLTEGSIRQHLAEVRHGTAEFCNFWCHQRDKSCLYNRGFRKSGVVRPTLLKPARAHDTLGPDVFAAAAAQQGR